ncbi:MAG: YbfB/YjiJ family MFS transporter [Phycisphaerales bacterium]|nr:YbfB/YjiJ family MFS transporter [Phycisphaerales bacterium]
MNTSIASRYMPERQLSLAYATIAGFCLIAIGLCMARFAYTPIVPSIIEAGWVDKAGAGYLGACNFLGYMTGCAVAIWLPRVVSVRPLMRWSLLAAFTGLLICAWDIGFVWLAVGRFITGLGGAALIIHTPAVMLKHVSDQAKSICGGIIFSGAGAAIVFVSLFLPYFVGQGPRDGWLFEAVLTLVGGIVSWRLISTAAGTPEKRNKALEALDSCKKLPLFFLGMAYVLAAVAVTPHAIFLVDYMHVYLKAGIGLSSTLFSLYGVGCFVGAILGGIMSRFMGNQLALVFNYLIGVLSIFMVLWTSSLVLVTAAGFLNGVFLFQCVALTALRTRDIVDLSRHAHYWGLITFSAAFGWIAGSYGLSSMLSRGVSYPTLFLIGGIVMVVATACVILSWLTESLPKRVC